MSGQKRATVGTLSPPNEFHPQEHSDDMRPTQVSAFQRIKDGGLLSRLRFLVYETIYQLQKPGRGVTSGELDRHITRKKATWTRSASPRLVELVRLGVIEEMGERKCSVTGQTVIEYQTTGSLPNPSGLKRNKWPKPSQNVLKEALGEMRRIYKKELDEGTAPSQSFVKVAQWIAGMIKADEKEGEELREEVMVGEVTCDWGGCLKLAVAIRHDAVHGWLPVCKRHLEEGDE